MRKILLIAAMLVFAGPAFAQSGGFNLTESDGFIYDANLEGGPKTDAQNAVDRVKALNAKHIEINLRAKMITGRGNELTPVTPPAERSAESRRILRLIKYIKSQGMTVGLRPIFFVVGPQDEFPYNEKMADGKPKLWWHGNIQPSDPDRWFESFRTYLEGYFTVANIGKVENFTIGAELYSMTVGVEDQWKEYPYGFPGRWLQLLRYSKAKMPGVRVMYDINFTDAAVTADGVAKTGGELERWRYRLVDLANRPDPAEKAIWQDLVSFWTDLDMVGIDMYRSLASANQPLPTDEKELVALLKQRSDAYASQLDTILNEIALTTGVDKKVFFKEIGFRSVDRSFVDPFTYAGTGTINLAHQAAAYDAFLQSFWDAKWPWFAGVAFWDIAVDPRVTGPEDKGFSPLGKPATENAIKRRYK